MKRILVYCVVLPAIVAGALALWSSRGVADEPCSCSPPCVTPTVCTRMSTGKCGCQRL